MKRTKFKTLTFNHFKGAVEFYTKYVTPNPKKFKDSLLRKLFYNMSLFLGQTTNTLSRDKILSYDYNFHNSVVKKLHIIKYGGSRNQCTKSNCDKCNDTYSGCSCDCAYGSCAGQCVAGECDSSCLWGCI